MFAILCVFSLSNHYFKEKKSLGAPNKNFMLKVAVELSLENRTDNFRSKELKLSSYKEYGYGNKTTMLIVIMVKFRTEKGQVFSFTRKF